MSKIIDKWRHLFEKYYEATCPGQWWGFYCQGVDDPAFVIQCASDFISFGRLQYQLILHLIVKCFTIGTQPICLSEWVCPRGEFNGFFHQTNIIYAKGGPKVDDKQQIISFFYSKEDTLGWNLERWGWVKDIISSTKGLSLVVNMWLICAMVWLELWKNGKVAFLANINFVGHMCGILLVM